MIIRPGTIKGRTQAKFLELRGHSVVEGANILWHRYRDHSFISLPWYVLPDVEPEEVSDFLRRTGGIAARFPSRELPGLPSGLYVRRQGTYGLHSLPVRMRNYVRRGLDRCEIRVLDPDFLLREGFPLNIDTMRRHGNWEPEFGDPVQWKRLVRAMEQCPGIEAVGAFVDGRLASYVLLCREDGWVQLLYQRNLEELREHRPVHTLMYSVMRQATEDPAIEAVADCPVPLDTNCSVHQFKMRIGFEIEPYHCAFALHPAASLLAANRITLGLTRVLARRDRNSTRLAQLEGLLESAMAVRTAARGCPDLRMVER